MQQKNKEEIRLRRLIKEIEYVHVCCQNHSHTLNVGAHTGSHANKTVRWTTTTKTTTRQHGSVRCISASCAHTVFLTWTFWQAVQLGQPEIAPRGTGEVTTGNWSRHATQQSTRSLNDTRRRPIFKRATLRSSGTERRGSRQNAGSAAAAAAAWRYLHVWTQIRG